MAEVVERDWPLLIDDDSVIHQWTEEEQECLIMFDSVQPHSHFMRCLRCGIRRYGAFAEPGAYHYFLYDHLGISPHEIVPPCTITPPQFEEYDVKVCSHCRHIVFDEAEDCEYGHIGLLSVRGLRRKK